MIDVTDGADVAVWFVTFEFCLRHGDLRLSSVELIVFDLITLPTFL